MIIKSINKNNIKYSLKKVYRWGGFRTFIILKNGIEIKQLPPNINKDLAINKFNDIIKKDK